MTKKKKRYSLEDFTSLTQKNQQALFNAGITEIKQLAIYPLLDLKTLLDTTIPRANAILKEAMDALPPFSVKTGAQLLEEQENREHLTTNCSAIDQCLGGFGLEAGSITEVFAQFGTGKSQLAFSAICSGLLNGSVIVIDTESTVSIVRIKEILSYYTTTQKVEEALQNLHIVQPQSSSEQQIVLKSFLEDNAAGYLKYFKANAPPLKLIIIDSLTALFRAQFIGRGTLSERQQRLNQHLRELHLFAQKAGVPALVTNQVLSSPDPFHHGEFAVGGNVIASTYRLSMQKRGGGATNAKNLRVIKMVDSSRLKTCEKFFKLGNRGVIDITEDNDQTPEQYKNRLKEESN